jgi:hypothetical protein
MIYEISEDDLVSHIYSSVMRRELRNALRCRPDNRPKCAKSIFRLSDRHPHPPNPRFARLAIGQKKLEPDRGPPDTWQEVHRLDFARPDPCPERQKRDLSYAYTWQIDEKADAGGSDTSLGDTRDDGWVGVGCGARIRGSMSFWGQGSCRLTSGFQTRNVAGGFRRSVVPLVARGWSTMVGKSPNLLSCVERTRHCEFHLCDDRNVSRIAWFKRKGVSGKTVDELVGHAFFRNGQWRSMKTTFESIVRTNAHRQTRCRFGSSENER